MGGCVLVHQAGEMQHSKRHQRNLKKEATAAFLLRAPATVSTFFKNVLNLLDCRVKIDGMKTLWERDRELGEALIFIVVVFVASRYRNVPMEKKGEKRTSARRTPFE